jgi:hypothetical protein
MYSMHEEDGPPARQGPRLVTGVPAAARPAAANGAQEREEPLPLPGWLTKLYFAFPIILYIPDAIFNYFVYSDGVAEIDWSNPILGGATIALWFFLSVGVVGMAYLLSVLAPWHWMKGHRVQAFFCALGVVIATAITTWNSLAFRSTNFVAFVTDQWAYGVWPALQANHVSVTMIIAAVAPPFWGLFWAIVQPVQNKRSLEHMQGSHAERMMRLQQEGEMKALKAQTAAQVREAQLRGMAQTAAVVREQAGTVAAQWRNGRKLRDGGDAGEAGAASPAPAEEVASAPAAPAEPLRYGGSLGREQAAAKRAALLGADQGGDEESDRDARAAATLEPPAADASAPAAPRGRRRAAPAAADVAPTAAPVVTRGPRGGGPADDAAPSGRSIPPRPSGAGPARASRTPRRLPSFPPTHRHTNSEVYRP